MAPWKSPSSFKKRDLSDAAELFLTHRRFPWISTSHQLPEATAMSSEALWSPNNKRSIPQDAVSFSVWKNCLSNWRNLVGKKAYRYIWIRYTQTIRTKTRMKSMFVFGDSHQFGLTITTTIREVPQLWRFETVNIIRPGSLQSKNNNYSTRVTKHDWAIW